MIKLVVILCWGEEIEKSSGYPWNGWVRKLDDNLWSFRTGSWADAFEHLKKCEKCREANNLTIEEIEDELRKSDEEWREVMGRDVDERV